VLLPFG